MTSGVRLGYFYQKCISSLYIRRVCSICGYDFNIISSIGCGATYSTSCYTHIRQHIIGTKTTFPCCNIQESEDSIHFGCHKISHVFNSFEEQNLKSMNTSSFCTLYRNISSESSGSVNKCRVNFPPNCGENFIVALPMFAIRHIYRVMNSLAQSKYGTFMQFDETQLDFEQDMQEVSSDELFQITSFFNLHKPTNKSETISYDFKNGSGTEVMKKPFVVFDNSDSFAHMVKNGQLEMGNPFSDLIYSINLLSAYNFVQKLCGIEHITSINQLHKSSVRPTKRCFNSMGKYKPEFSLDELVEENEKSYSEESHSVEENSFLSFNQTEESESEMSENAAFLDNVIENVKKRGKFIQINKSSRGISKSRRNRNTTSAKMEYDSTVDVKKEMPEKKGDYPVKLVSGQNAPISDSYYGQLSDLNEIDTRPIELIRALDHKILPPDALDIHPFSSHTASLQRLIHDRKSTGVMTFNDLRDLHLNVDGIFETTFIDNPPVAPDMNIYTNPRARTRLPSGNNAQLGNRSHQLFDSYIHKLNTLKVQDEIATRMTDTENRLSQEKKTIFLKKWDVDSTGFIPFVILINAHCC